MQNVLGLVKSSIPVNSSVVDRHLFDADPDPNFHFDAELDPDLDPEWHQNNADPHAEPTQSFTVHILENRKKKRLLLYTAMSVINVFPFL